MSYIINGEGSSLKPRKIRTRTGCLCCRLRKKKCNEIKPTCSGCQRNSLLCTWPEQHLNLPKSRNKTRKISQVDDASPPPLRWNSRQEHIDTESDYDTVEESDTWLNCLGSYENRNGSEEVRFRNLSTSIPQSLDPQALFNQTIFRNSMSRTLFDHYLDRTNKMMSISPGDRNPFIIQLLPIAMEHSGLFECVLALSGVHYADRMGDPVDETTWSHYGKALQRQKMDLTAISQGNEGAIIPALITSLILCTIEVISPSSIFSLMLKNPLSRL